MSQHQNSKSQPIQYTVELVILEGFNFGKFGDFPPFTKIKPINHLLCTCSFNDTCLTIRHFKICQPTKKLLIHQNLTLPKLPANGNRTWHIQYSQLTHEHQLQWQYTHTLLLVIKCTVNQC